MEYIKLSVVIPCYNVENYIEECIESVISQKVNNIEIILVDDASSDDTYQICKKIKDEYSCITLLRHDVNQGQEETRNDGLNNAKGEWILFLDGDDVLTPGVLSMLLEKATGEIDIILSRFLYFDKLTSHEARCNLINEFIYSAGDIAKLMGVELPWDMVSCSGNKIYNKDFITNNNLKFDIKYKYNEDGGFAVNAFMNSCKTKYIDVVLYCYRQNYSGIMSSYKKNAFISLNEVNNLLEDYFFQHSCNDAQWIFLNKKRLDNLKNSINSEIQFGTKKGFYEQIDLIVNSHNIVKQINYLLENNKCSEIDKQYIMAIRDKKYDVLYSYARNAIVSRLYRQWLYKQKTGANIINVLQKKRIKRLGIYGAGDVGRLLAAEIKGSELKVDYFIDINEKNVINYNIPVVYPDKNIPTTELIVNTVLMWNGDIMESLGEKTNIPLMSIWELLS